MLGEALLYGREVRSAGAQAASRDPKDKYKKKAASAGGPPFILKVTRWPDPALPFAFANVRY
jgi:hypothetical protein